MVRHRRPTHCTQIDRIVPLDLVQSVLGHHAAGAVVAVTAPIQVIPGELDAEPRGYGVEHADALRHHLLADTIAGDDSNPVFRHFAGSLLFVTTYERLGPPLVKPELISATLVNSPHRCH